MTRRKFLLGTTAMAVPLSTSSVESRLKIAVITDLHHGLAPDAATRLEAFVDAVAKRPDIDVVLQLGDFCYSDSKSAEAIYLWRQIKPPTIHVLGNHDMDKCDKGTAMHRWGMPARYGAYVHGGYRFVVLDLNNFLLDGEIHPYSNGNYFSDGAQCNWADPEQLAWLEHELRSSREPVILLSHQPIGFAEKGQPMPPEQQPIIDIIQRSAKANPRGAVSFCLCGHLHVDRLEMIGKVPSLCVNSASYFWYSGMQAYTRPLFAFMDIRSGKLSVDGSRGEFMKPPPANSDWVVGRSASIRDRELNL